MSRHFYRIASAVFCAAGFVSIAVADTSRQETNDRPPARAELSDTVKPWRRYKSSFAITPAEREAAERLLNASPAVKNAFLEAHKQNRKSDRNAFYARREATRLALEARQRDWEETRKAWQQKQRDAKSSR